MSLVGVVSAKGSPGVSTVAMELLRRWPREVVGIELDPSGGSWALRYEGLSWDPGVVSLAASPGRLSVEFVAEHGSAVGRHGVVVCASPFGEQVRATLDLLIPRLAGWPDELDGIVDVGRYDPVTLPVLAACMVTVVVSRTRPEDIGQLQRLGEVLRSKGIDGRLLLIGSEPPFYSPVEIAQTVGLSRIDVDVPFAAAGKRNRAFEQSFSLLTETVASHCAVASPVSARTLAEFGATLRTDRDRGPR
jgi:hypothetical protein